MPSGSFVYLAGDREGGAGDHLRNALYLYLYILIYPFVYLLCIHLFIFIFIDLFIYVFIYLFIFIDIFIDIFIAILFEGVWFANDPSSLPLCAVFPGSSRGFRLGDSQCSRRSNATFLKVACPPTPFSFEAFWA